jgi:opacity protein-like surface antigen
MKKLCYSFSFFLLICHFSNAQLLKIGIKAGVNYANFKSSTLQTDALTSYHAGIAVDIKFIKPLSFQPEVIYSTQGASYKTVVQDFKSELGYVSVPILAKLHLGKTLSLQAGPQFSFLMSKKVDKSTNSNEFDFALAGGLEIMLTEKLFIHGRYTVGLTDVDKNADFKNSVGQLSLGYYF